MKNTLSATFDFNYFRKEGHQLIDLIANHLENSTIGKKNGAHTWLPPSERLKFWENEWKKEDFDLQRFTQQILDQSIHLHHPKYVGHQVGVPAPVTLLMSLLSATLNNGMAIYEVGQAATTLEHIVTQEIAQYFGFGKMANGILTSGGTLGNLTALLTARNVKARGEIWKNGQQQKLAIMVSEEAHYCVDRAVRTMGWGEDGVIKVPVDEQFRMKTDLLQSLLEQAQSKDIQVIAIVGSACTTSTGTFDNLEAIGAFCKLHDLWFHVDGAHGGATIFSLKYKSLLKGIEQADSVVMDFHKMLLMPSLTTGVFYREARNSYLTFAQKAHYLWSNSEETEWFNPGKRTYECTKLMMSLRVYAFLKTHGVKVWSEYIERMFDLSEKFAALIKTSSNFELAVEPDGNIICFRYLADGDLNQLNERIRQQILEEEEFYMVKTQLKDKIYLRTTLMSPFTTLEDLQKLLKRVEEVAISLSN